MTTPLPKIALVPDAEPAAQAIRDGRYVVVGTLGAGSQGETLEAVDKREGRAVAVKRFTIRGAKSWKDVELAEREATVLASLSHPHLPRYIEHFEEDGALYLVMEKVEGESLAARRKRNQALDHEQVLRFLRDAAACLRYLHGRAPPIVHRDIKPGNVLLRPDGSYCFVDFGSVRDRLKPEGGSTVVGTFGFMAPEQFQGRAAPASDVYAVGATALCLVTGREPEDLPHKGLAIDVESALRGQVDKRLIAALRSMLEPDPDRRAGSVDVALKGAGLSGAGSSRANASPSSAPSAKPRSAQDAKNARRERLEAEDRERDRGAGGWDHPGEVARHIQREIRRNIEREERRARQIAKRETHRAKREARRLERVARHWRNDWRPPGPPVLPGRVLGAVIMLALAVASVGTFALFGVLLPLLFTVLTNPRRRERMFEISAAGQRGIARAREHIRYQFAGGPMPAELAAFLAEGKDKGADAPFEAGSADPTARPSAASRQRVATDAEEAEIEAAAAEEAERAAKGSPS